MKPTNKLRFVRRAVPDKTFGDNIAVYQHILQQWWESGNITLAVHIEDKDGNQLPSPHPGEWRDIPIEEDGK